MAETTSENETIFALTENILQELSQRFAISEWIGNIILLYIKLIIKNKVTIMLCTTISHALK